MLHGHGDDIYSYSDISINFSSNVYNHFDHSELYAYLASCLPSVTNYPEPTSASLERRIADRHGIQPSQVMATNGAIEAIYLIANSKPVPLGQLGAACRIKPLVDRSLIISPTFSEYADACLQAGIAVSASPKLDVINDIPLVWLCNPNNPTGTVIPHSQIREVIDANPHTVFIVDASYAHFTDKQLLSVAEAVARPNVIMLHSMTKRFAVPGLRIGYVTAHSSLIQQLRCHQMPWSVNSIAQKAAMYLIEHENSYQIPLQQLLAERRRIAAALKATGYIDVHPSDTHILLCRLQHGSSADLKHQLAVQHGILIRDASNFHGLTTSHFRIAVQTTEENDKLIRILS